MTSTEEKNVEGVELVSEEKLLDQVIEHLADGNAAKAASQIEGLHAAEAASLLEALPPMLRKQVWELLPVELEGDTLAHLGEAARGGILKTMEDNKVVAAAEYMNDVDLAGVIETLPGDLTETLLKSLADDRRLRLETALSFADGTVGRLMSADVISVRSNVSISVVTRYLRRLKPLPRHTNALMVVDAQGHYLGKLYINDVVTESPDTLVEDVMIAMADSLQADAKEHDVAVLFEQRDLISAAVLDSQGILLGRITVDDAVHIIRAEADKVMLAQGGLSEEEDLFSPVLPSAKRRAVWLGINLVTVFMAAWVIGRFEEALDKIVALAVLLPVVASMGGIAGCQTLTLTIRGLALGQVSKTNLRWLCKKEVLVGLINGLGWAVAVAIVTYFWFQDVGIAAIIAVAMIVNLIAASASGVLVPVVLNRMGIDPALSGAVVLTTVTDIVGFMSFLGLATLFLL